MPIDRRSDIFAVGVILYEMLTGEKLFVGESDFSTLEKVRNAEVPAAARSSTRTSPRGSRRSSSRRSRASPRSATSGRRDLQEDLMRFLLAGDAIYSGKHLSSFMKEAFAEDMLREAEKMERFASIEKPGPDRVLRTSPRRPLRRSAAPRKPSKSRPGGASRRALPSASSPPRRSRSPRRYIPPPTAEELAEMDGAGDKTQIVDSAMALVAAPRACSSTTARRARIRRGG